MFFFKLFSLNIYFFSILISIFIITVNSGGNNELKNKIIKLINCPPDHVIVPCKCSKFTVSYLKPDIVNSLYHNMEEYNKVNVYLICSTNNDSFNLTQVFNRIYSFYVGDFNEFIKQNNRKLERKNDKYIKKHDLNIDYITYLNESSNQEVYFDNNYDYEKPVLNIYGFISNVLPFINYEFNFVNIQFDYIDISYTNLRKISFKWHPNSIILNRVQTLILAYNQLENDYDENLNLPIQMSHLTIELNKFQNLKVLVLKGNRLKHFNLPNQYINLREFIQINSLNSNHFNQNIKNSHFINKYNNNHLIQNAKYLTTKIEVFKNLISLDLSENLIELIAPISFKLLPKLLHLNLMSNNIQKIYGRSFIFSYNQSKNVGNEHETIISDLDKIFDENLDVYIKENSKLKPIYNLNKDNLNLKTNNYGTFSFENKISLNKTLINTDPDNIINIYLGNNNLDCSKINQFAFIKIDKKFTLHLDMNNFEYLCEDLFENLISSENLIRINLYKNPIKCMHCGNKWLFSSKTKLEARANLNQYETFRKEKIKKYQQDLFGNNFTYYFKKELPSEPLAGLPDPKPIKHDLSKITNIKCVNPTGYEYAQLNKNLEMVYLLDFDLNSFSHCNLKKKQLIQSLKHFAIFLKAFNVLPQSNLERINEILD